MVSFHRLVVNDEAVPDWPLSDKPVRLSLSSSMNMFVRVRVIFFIIQRPQLREVVLKKGAVSLRDLPHSVRLSLVTLI